MPPHKNSENFDPDAKINRFRSLHKNQINADRQHWNEVIFDNAHINQINFILHWNQVKFDPPHWNQVNLNHTKCKSICMITLKTSNFRPAFKNHANFDHPLTTTKSISSLYWNPVIFDPPHWYQVNLDHPHKNQVNFHAYPENKWFSASIYTSNKSISTTHTTKSISSLHWNQVKFDPPHWEKANFDHHKKQVNFYAHTKNKWFSIRTQKQGRFWPPHKKSISVLTLKPSQFLSPTQPS